jgi:HEAT repeat protein
MPQTTTTPAPPKPPVEFQEGAIGKMDSAGLVKILTDAAASEFQKARACQRAGELGAVQAVPAMAALLSSEHLNTYARYGLEPIADPSVDEALRASLPKLKGRLLIGVINSIAKRRDAKAGAALAPMMQHTDPEVSTAAVAALGRIGGVSSMKQLQTALGKTTGVVRMAVADACLVCAEGLLAAGQRNEALALYTFLSAPETPKPVRLAAMQAIIREETSTRRPR